ncbi:MAG TPA: hypothetical protein VLM85_09805 [Polyangiaceae bacterium]|nr:hypothetical protein [Polyangiaceae bacterium]
MIPVGPIVWLVVAAARGLNASGQPAVFRNRRQVSSHGALKMLSWLFLVVWLIYLVSGEVTVGGFAFGVALVLYQFPYACTGQTLVRLGWPRAAYWAALVTGALWRFGDVAGGACLLAARARLRMRTPTRQIDDWLHRRLRRAKKRGGAWYVAAALFEAGRGNTAWARGLLLSAEVMSPQDCPACARKVARRWLVADAAARGDWRRAAELSAPHRTERDLWCRAAHELAMARAHPAFAPRTLLGRIARALYGLPQPAPLRNPAAVEPTLTAVLTAHVATVRRPGDADGILATARAWEELFDSAAWEAEVARRGLGQGAKSTAQDVMAQMGEEVADDLAHALVEARVPLGALRPTGAISSAAKNAARELYLRRVDERVANLGERVAAELELDPHEEGVEAGLLRDVYIDAILLGGDDLRPVLFPKIESVATRHGVWLDNRASRVRFIAHPIFRWLLDEARTLGKLDSIKLEQSNCAATR